MKINTAILLALNAAINAQDPERRFLLDHGWIPLGKSAVSGLEGWVKMIDKKAVIVDQPEALEIERKKKSN